MMDKQQQEAYDFFMRMAALAEDRAAKLAHLADRIDTDKLYRRSLADAENCQLWASRIKAGWRMVDK